MRFDVGSMARIVAAGIRYRFRTGLRQAMKVWGVLLVLIAIAEGLEAPLPISRWALEWSAASGPRKGLVAFGILALLALTCAPLLRKAVRNGADASFRLLPVAPSFRFAIDLAAALLFLTAPLLLPATILTVAHQHDSGPQRFLYEAGIAAALAIASAALLALHLDPVPLLQTIAASGTFLLVCLGSFTTNGQLGVWIALVGSGIVFGIARQIASRTFHDFPRPDRASPPVEQSFALRSRRLVPLRNELRWLSRGGATVLSPTMFVSSLAAFAAVLAIRNNDVTSELAIVRLLSFFATGGATLLALEVTGARHATREFRSHESLLPRSTGELGASLLSAATLRLLPLLALTLFVARTLSATAIAFVILYPLMLFVSLLFLTDATAVSRNVMEEWWAIGGGFAAAFAVAFAPWWTLLATALLLVSATRTWRKRIEESDLLTGTRVAE